MRMQRAVVATGDGRVRVEDVPFNGLAVPPLPGVQRHHERMEHGVVLRLLATCICGSDLHSINNPGIPVGTVCGHEATGVVEEIGRDVHRVRIGDICSIPFNVSCGRCSYCARGLTAHCQFVADGRLGATYGLGPELGGWPGLQAQWALIPFGDFNLHVFTDRAQAMDRLIDISALADTLPTGYHAAVQGRVGVGSSVYIAGAGPVGLAAAASSRLLGAAVVIMGDPNESRRAHAEKMGFKALDPTVAPIAAGLEEIHGDRFVDASIDCVGGSATNGVLDALIECTRPAGSISIAGVYPSVQAGSPPKAPVWLGGVWSKALTISAGATPAKKYQQRLSDAIFNGQLDCVRLLGMKTAALEDAPEAYAEFAGGTAGKFVLVPS